LTSSFDGTPKTLHWPTLVRSPHVRLDGIGMIVGNYGRARFTREAVVDQSKPTAPGVNDNASD